MKAHGRLFMRIIEVVPQGLIQFMDIEVRVIFMWVAINFRGCWFSARWQFRVPVQDGMAFRDDKLSDGYFHVLGRWFLAFLLQVLFIKLGIFSCNLVVGGGKNWWMIVFDIAARGRALNPDLGCIMLDMIGRILFNYTFLIRQSALVLVGCGGNYVQKGTRACIYFILPLWKASVD